MLTFAAAVHQEVRTLQVPGEVKVMVIPAEADVVASMVKKYVKLDRDLTEQEIFHFMNWIATLCSFTDQVRHEIKQSTGVSAHVGS